MKSLEKMRLLLAHITGEHQQALALARPVLAMLNMPTTPEEMLGLPDTDAELDRVLVGHAQKLLSLRSDDAPEVLLTGPGVPIDATAEAEPETLEAGS